MRRARGDADGLSVGRRHRREQRQLRRLQQQVRSSPAPGKRYQGSFAANRFGLYDMVGNVWKWVRTVIIPITTEHPLMVQRGLVEIAPPASSAAVPGAPGLGLSARPSATGALSMTGITPWASGSAERLLFPEA